MAQPADGRADQFALGAILYEMLTGRRAFRRDTPLQTMSSILEDEPQPITEVRPDVPAAPRRNRRTLPRQAARAAATPRRAISRTTCATCIEQLVVDSAIRTRDAGAAADEHGDLVASGGDGGRAAVGARNLAATVAGSAGATRLRRTRALHRGACRSPT